MFTSALDRQEGVYERIIGNFKAENSKSGPKNSHKGEHQILAYNSAYKPPSQRGHYSSDANSSLARYKNGNTAQVKSILSKSSTRNVSEGPFENQANR